MQLVIYTSNHMWELMGNEISSLHEQMITDGLVRSLASKALGEIYRGDLLVYLGEDGGRFHWFAGAFRMEKISDNLMFALVAAHDPMILKTTKGRKDFIQLEHSCDHTVSKRFVDEHIKDLFVDRSNVFPELISVEL